MALKQEFNQAAAGGRHGEKIMRTITLFNDNWVFIRQDVGAEAAASTAGETVKLPHTWNARDGQDGGGDYYRGTCWYVKRFSRPVTAADEQVWLEFRGAAMTAEVWLNGQRLARHEGATPPSGWS